MQVFLFENEERGASNLDKSIGKIKPWKKVSNMKCQDTEHSLGLRICVCLCSRAQYCLTLCNPMNVARQAPLSMGILQTRILERVAISSSRGSSRPREGTCASCSSCTGRWVLYGWSPMSGKPSWRVSTGVRKEPEMATSDKYCFWGRSSCFDKWVVTL